MSMNIGIMAWNSGSGNGGATNIYACNLVKALADYGHRHIYIVLVEESNLKFWHCRKWPAHIQFKPLHSVEPRQLVTVRAWRFLSRSLHLSAPYYYGEPYVAKQVDSLGLDLLHCPRTTIWPLSMNTPCVLTFFDMQHEHYPQFFTQQELEQRKLTYRPSVEKARHIIAPSAYTCRDLAENYAVPNDKMSLIPVGIDKDFQRVQDSEIRRIKEKYSLPDNFIFYPANPWQHKNHARLMAALRIYRQRHGIIPWLVLSGRLGNERREALSLAIAAGVEDSVLDLGLVASEDLPALYSAATLLIFPSLFEGFGMPLVEAMACGCPIVAADATTIPEVTNGAAYLFNPLDPEAMAAAIYEVWTDKTLREHLIQRGYEQLPRFNWCTIVHQLEEVYDQVASKRA